MISEINYLIYIWKIFSDLVINALNFCTAFDLCKLFDSLVTGDSLEEEPRACRTKL